MKLNIDFVSQQGNVARNDCGAACVAMVTTSAIDDVLLVANVKKNEPLHVDTIRATLRAYRVGNEHVRPLHLPDARRWLANGNPIIALVNYGRLPAQERATDYDGNHYALLVGYTADGGFLVHDPLWPDQAGAYRHWDDVALGEAWTNPIDALPLQGVVVQRPFAVREPEMGELGLAVNAALNHAVAIGYLEQLYNLLEIAPGRLEERQGHALARIVGLNKNP